MAFKRYMGFLQNHKLEDNLGGIADCFDSRDDKQTVLLVQEY